MADDKSPYVLVSVFKEDAKPDEISGAAGRIAAIVDDWNFEDTRKGTQRALKEGGYKIHFQQILPARRNGDKVQFWNGMAVFV